MFQNLFLAFPSNHHEDDNERKTVEKKPQRRSGTIFHETCVLSVHLKTELFPHFFRKIFTSGLRRWEMINWMRLRGWMIKLRTRKTESNARWNGTARTNERDRRMRKKSERRRRVTRSQVEPMSRDNWDLKQILFSFFQIKLFLQIYKCWVPRHLYVFQCHTNSPNIWTLESWTN